MAKKIMIIEIFSIQEAKYEDALLGEAKYNISYKLLDFKYNS